MKTKSKDNTAKDEKTLIAILKEMAESMTGAQSTRHWAEDALWFDIPPFASKGLKPALDMFDRVFNTLSSCRVEILEWDVTVNGSMGVVRTIQKVKLELKKGGTKSVMVRQTDCFEKRNNRWQLFHEHASIPSGGEWDGKIKTD
jgi:ketosteroid isomerase-like protein